MTKETSVVFLAGLADTLDFNASGLIALAGTAGLVVPPEPVNAPYNGYLLRRAVHPGDPLPCQRLLDGTGIYVVRGVVGGLDAETLNDPADPAQPYTLICPGRPAQVIAARTPTPR